jgi:predicted nucleic acid-binding protein
MSELDNNIWHELLRPPDKKTINESRLELESYTCNELLRPPDELTVNESMLERDN